MITLGPHNIGLATAHAREWAKHAAVVKQVDEIDLLQAAGADVIKVFRCYFPNQDLDASPYEVARSIIAKLRGYRSHNLYVEVYNEIGKTGRDLYIRLLLGVVPLLHNAGLKVCGPCWSTGDFEWTDWQAFGNVNWCGLDALNLHGYWGQWGFTLDHALRYRRFWNPSVDPALLIVSECGRDVVEDGGRGWKKDAGAEVYMLELTQYSRELAKDGVVGVVFQEGSSDPQWADFDTKDLDLSLLYVSGGKTSEGAQTLPNIGTGFAKCVEKIGNFTEDEVYHGSNGPPQTTTSLAIAQRGFAVWRKKTNETLCVTDDKRIFADDGGGSLIEYVKRV